MSEKRFKKMDTIIDPFPIWDTVEEKGYNCTDTLDLLVDLLNELSEENEELNKQVNNYHATFQSLLKTNLILNNQLAETQKELNELYESLFPKPDLEHLNCRCSYEPIE